MWDRWLIGWLEDPSASPERGRVTSRHVIIVLTLLGALIRFVSLGGVRITHDLAWQGWEAARILSGVFPLIGQPSSVFLDNPPLMGYIQAIPLFFWRSPWSIFIFITALNTLAIPFIFSAVEQVFGRRIAVLSTLLFVINPWVAHFSRMTWTQGLLPFFLAVMFWGWLPVFARTDVDDSPALAKRFLWGWVAFIAMLQTYIMAFSMLLPASLFMLIFWRKLPKKQLWIGVGLLSASLLFYGWSVAQNLDQNSGKFADFLSELANPTEEAAKADTTQFLNFTDDAIIHAMRLITGRDFVGQDINGPDPAGTIPVPVLSQIARWVLSAAFLLGLIVILLKRSANGWVLLIWFFVPVGMMMVLPSSVFVHPHYLLFTLPAGGIIVALGFDWLIRQHRFVAYPVMGVIFLFGGQFLLSTMISNGASASNPYVYELDALPLAQAGQLGQQMRILAGEPQQGRPIRAISPASDQILSSISGRWFDSVGGLRHPNWTFFNSEKNIIVIMPPKPDSNQASVESVEFIIENEIGNSTETGMTLLHWQVIEVDVAHLEVQTYWRVDVLHDERVEWFVSPFVHLIDADGQTIANQAPYGQWGYRWEVGDVYVNTMRFEQTDTAVKLGIGLFDPISGRTFMLFGEDGNTPRYEVALP